jgi:CDP-diglyceride synthetase
MEFILYVFVLGAALIALGTQRSLTEVLPSISISVAGLVFVVLPFSAVVRLHGVDILGPRLLLFTVVMVWAGDTCAFFVGREIGRWKMSPLISWSFICRCRFWLLDWNSACAHARHGRYW